MAAYYNEFDKRAAAWLRQLIADGQIADGDVDERSIADVSADDVRPYAQAHFFGGVGGWSLALRLAGVPDDFPVWTGSCPCQPFSAAGRQRGTADERHLWPHFARLIRECHPRLVLGEQVESAVGHGWWDEVASDLEAEGYAAGAVVLGAHSVGAPHRRQRLFWCGVADPTHTTGTRLGGVRINVPGTAGAGGVGGLENAARQRRGGGNTGVPSGGGRPHEAAGSGGVGGLADAGLRGQVDTDHAGVTGARSEERDASWRGVHVADLPGGRLGADGCAPGKARHADERRQDDRLADAGALAVQRVPDRGPDDEADRGQGANAGDTPGSSGLRGPWDRAVPVSCRDGKTRLVEPSIFPLAHGVPRGVVFCGDPRSEEYANRTQEGRITRLRGYGNAIVPQVAAEFIGAVLGR